MRTAHFPPVIHFSYLGRTGVVSATGPHCELACAHCGGHYLKAMLSPAEALRRARTPDAPASWLVSGGCDRRGRVPLDEHGDLLQSLGSGARLVLHVGLVQPEEAPLIARHAAVVAFDMVGDRQTAREVMGLDVGLEDYLATYRALAQEARVVPHLCIGLHGGRLQGEWAAVEALAAEAPEELVFLVFSPTPGTAFAGCRPPPLEAVGDFLAWARVQLPKVPLGLGCMRPRGSYREGLDELAVHLGVNGIAVPTPAAVRAARERGLTIRREEECCVLH
ncbi:MAG TPA: radical SAM protein [Clostridiales bacterium UBA8153]|nr:radical SAM protein [Clostridiales bacterium UBA8153]